MRTITYTIFALIFISCTKSQTQEVAQTDPLEKDQKIELVKVEELKKTNYDLDKLSYDGNLASQKIWRDANGENIVLFTQTEEELFVYHFAIDADSANLLRRVYDFEKDCEFDRILEFVAPSILVTDLDEDGLGEITFAYKKACVSDVSPLGLKLLMLENGEKYIIRGNTLISMGDESYGGEKNIDPSFENAPASFLTHAKEVWEKVVR